jgi:DNA-binding helix-hairpin-helix protein with protein kinase domain
MSTPTLFLNGQVLALGKRIGKGGEGDVYSLVDRSDVAVKVYTLKDLKSREIKIAAMLKQKLADGSKLVAFPRDIVRRKDGSFAGFTMQLVKDHRPLFELYAPGARKQNFPKADFRFLVRAASNIAAVVAHIHKANCVIGDINHSGILISRSAVAAMIDADSFQIQDGNQIHHCLVGVPEYTPPELQGQSLGKVVRTVDHDAFGLAVVMFQLLFMGRHPFMGALEKGDVALQQAIKDHRFVYSLKRNVGMAPPPGASTLRDLPKALADLFELAFSAELRRARPTALHWAKALQQSEAELIACKANAQHYFFRSAQQCPWCTTEKELGVALFLPHLAPVMTFQTGPFDIATFWASIEAVARPKPENFVPVVPNKTIAASWRARLFKLRRKLLQPLLAILLVINGGTYWFDHALVFVSGTISALIMFLLLREKPAVFHDHYQSATAQWALALKNWNSGAPFAAVDTAKQNLDAHYADFMRLKTDVEQNIAKAHAAKQHPLVAGHLKQFTIAAAKLKGLGEAKLQLLASHGIETVAHITETNIRAVPGFGQANTQTLLEWRTSLELAFYATPKPNAIDMQVVRQVHSDVMVKAGLLQKELQTGFVAYERAAKELISYRTTLNPKISATYTVRKQALADLKYLGLAVS